MITKRYRFYCALIDRDGQPITPKGYYEVMDQAAPSYTAISTDGVWRGDHEQGIMFEIVEVSDVDAMDPAKVRALANKLRVIGNQSAVLVTVDYSVEAMLIS